MRIGPTEILIIVLIVALLFGIGKIPQIGEAIGKGINAFRRGAKGEDEPKKKKKASAKKTSTKKAPVAAVSGEAGTGVSAEPVAEGTTSQVDESGNGTKHPEELAQKPTSAGKGASGEDRGA